MSSKKFTKAWVKSPLGIALLALGLLSACDKAEEGAVTEPVAKESVSEKIEANVYMFSEWENGVEPYLSRMIITDKYLRKDDGVDGEDFLLFDRESKVLSNLSLNDKIILRMKRKEVTLKPEKEVFSVRKLDTKDMPDIGGKQPDHHILLSDNKVCYQVVTLPDMDPDAVLAMEEFLLTLAGEQLENIDKTPDEFRDGCMMSNLIYEPVAHLKFGFPVREWDYNDNGRALVDFSTQQVDSSLFELDPSFSVYQLSETGLPAKIK